MNLFKVFASARKGFQEEYASAILAWLLNPGMEHGLGFATLAEFIGSIAVPGHPLHTFQSRLVTRMRTDDTEILRTDHHIELFVAGAFVDLVIVIDDWVLAVENKIFADSVERGQLTREYNGLRGHFGSDKHIAMIYLVPLDRDGPLDPRVLEEFNSLSIAGPDTKHLVSWQAGDAVAGAPPSVERIIRTLLEKEARCEITPVNEYTRHTLKAFCRFVADNFAGYDYDSADTGGLNPATEGRLLVAELADKNQGFVGVQRGLARLVLMAADQMTSHPFQYTTKDMSGRQGWLKIELFNAVVRWRRGDDRPDIRWDRELLPAPALDRIAAAYPTVYIGIRGGRVALERMSRDEIFSKKWRISTEPGGAEWVEGKEFHRILRDKGVGADTPEPVTAPPASR
jgi:hypothetical protein